MYKLVACDTDSIKIARIDGQEMSEEEMDAILHEMNSATPELIQLEVDGYYPRFLVIKSKNYVTDNGKKIEYKGSGIMDQKKEPALKELLFKLIHTIMDEKNNFEDIYNEYIEEAKNIKDINRWTVKKTITDAVLNGERKTETKVKDALEGQVVQEGDKIWLYNAIDGEIQAVEKGQPKFYKKTGLPKMIPNKILKTPDKWNGDEDKQHYLNRVYATVEILSNVLDMDRFKKVKL